jgi:hypothetical protein
VATGPQAPAYGVQKVSTNEMPPTPPVQSGVAVDPWGSVTHTVPQGAPAANLAEGPVDPWALAYKKKKGG